MQEQSSRVSCCNQNLDALLWHRHLEQVLRTQGGSVSVEGWYITPVQQCQSLVVTEGKTNFFAVKSNHRHDKESMHLRYLPANRVVLI